MTDNEIEDNINKLIINLGRNRNNALKDKNRVTIIDIPKNPHSKASLLTQRASLSRARVKYGRSHPQGNHQSLDHDPSRSLRSHKIVIGESFQKSEEDQDFDAKTINQDRKKRHRHDRSDNSNTDSFSADYTKSPRPSGQVKRIENALRGNPRNLRESPKPSKTFHISSSEDESNNQASFFDIIKNRKNNSSRPPLNSPKNTPIKKSNTDETNGQAIDSTLDDLAETGKANFKRIKKDEIGGNQEEGPYEATVRNDRVSYGGDLKEFVPETLDIQGSQDIHTQDTQELKKEQANPSSSSSSSPNSNSNTNQQMSTPLRSEHFKKSIFNVPAAEQPRVSSQMDTFISSISPSYHHTSTSPSKNSKPITVPNLTLSILMLKINNKVMWANKSRNISFNLTMNFITRAFKVTSTSGLVFEAPLSSISKIMYSIKKCDTILVFRSTFETLSSPSKSHSSDTQQSLISKIGVSIGIRLNMKHEATLKTIGMGVFKSRLEKITGGLVDLVSLTAEEHNSVLKILGKERNINVTLSSDSEPEYDRKSDSDLLPQSRNGEDLANAEGNLELSKTAGLVQHIMDSSADFEIPSTPIPVKPIAEDLEQEIVTPDRRRYSGNASKAQGYGSGEDHLMFRYPFTSTTSIHVSKQDYLRLEEGEFLNDTLIDFYLRFLFENLKKTNEQFSSQVFMYSSFFYELYCKYSIREKEKRFDSVRKWTSKVDILSKKYLFVPINKNYHWFLALIVNPNLLVENGKETSPNNSNSQKSPEDQISDKASNITKSPELSAFSGPKGLENGKTRSEVPADLISVSRLAASNPSSPRAQNAPDSDQRGNNEEKSAFGKIECSDNVAENVMASTREVVSLSDLAKLVQLENLSDSIHSADSIFAENSQANETGKETEDNEISLLDIQLEATRNKTTPENSSQNFNKDESVDSNISSAKSSSTEPPVSCKQDEDDEILDDFMMKKYWFRDSFQQSPEVIDGIGNENENKTEDIGGGGATDKADSGTNGNARGRSGKTKDFRDKGNYVDLDSKTWIVIFDSLGGRHRSVLENLNTYVRSIVSDITGLETDGIIQGCYAKVPRQPNYSDCGLYLLQYVEEFMKDSSVLEKLINRIEMDKWFTLERMSQKRSELKKLCHILANRYKQSELPQNE